MKVKVRAYRPYTGIQHRMQDTAVFQDSVYFNSEDMKDEFVQSYRINNSWEFDRIKGHVDLQAYSEGVRYCNYNCECKPLKSVRKHTAVSVLCNAPYNLVDAMSLNVYRISAMFSEFNRIA